MRWNEPHVLSLLSSRSPDWEGRLCHRPPAPGSMLALQPVFKERYFKLLGNLLFCLRLGQDGRPDTADPVAVLVLEQCSVIPEAGYEVISTNIFWKYFSV